MVILPLVKGGRQWLLEPEEQSMKRERLTDVRIVRILQEADRAPVAEVAKRQGVSEPSIYAWRKKFGDMGTASPSIVFRSARTDLLPLSLLI
jgi:hypothetical protein